MRLFDQVPLTGGSPDSQISLPLVVFGARARESWPFAIVPERDNSRGIRFIRGIETLSGVARFSTEAGLEAASAQAYQAIFELCQRQGFTRYLKFWNFVPRINELDPVTRIEVYRAFSLGRASSFDRNPAADGRPQPFPSAVGIGHHDPSGDLVVQFVAAADARRAKVIHLENPAQAPAYRYSPKYGPRAPTFSRATYFESGAGRWIFVSGTASILGHDSVHAGDLDREFATTIQNLQILLGRENLGNHGITVSEDLFPRLENLRIYVRSPDLVDRYRALSASAFPSTSATLFHADICRIELTVEIEGFVRI